MTVRDLINADDIFGGTPLNLFLGDDYVWYSDTESDVDPIDQLKAETKLHDYEIETITANETMCGLIIFLKENKT